METFGYTANGKQYRIELGDLCFIHFETSLQLRWYSLDFDNLEISSVFKNKSSGRFNVHTGTYFLTDKGFGEAILNILSEAIGEASLITKEDYEGILSRIFQLRKEEQEMLKEDLKVEETGKPLTHKTDIITNLKSYMKSSEYDLRCIVGQINQLGGCNKAQSLIFIGEIKEKINQVIDKLQEGNLKTNC